MIARILLVLFLVVAAGCAKDEPPARAPAADVSTPAPAAAPAFAGRTWKVTQSSAVAPGTTYEFREGGTLVVTSPGSPPLTGSWAWSDGKLTMTEEGMSYPTDILALDDGTFRIRSHNPGEPVEITMERVVP